MKSQKGVQRVFAFLLSTLLTIPSICQTPQFLSWIDNINIPGNNTGVMPEWCVTVDDEINGNAIHKLFVHGPQGILVYNLAGGGCTFSTKIEFSGFAHGYYERMHNSYLVTFPAHEPMIYVPEQEGVGKIFAVGSDLNLYCINVVENSVTQIPHPEILNGCLLRSTKMEFDPVNDRLLWLANVYSINLNDYFTFLAQVDLSTFPYTLQSFFTDLGKITDFAVNDDVNVDLIYIGYAASSTSFQWMLRKRSDLSFIQSFSIEFAPGLINYVHTADIHQVYCLPGHFILFPGYTPPTDITIIEGNTNNPTPASITSPAPHFTCSEFNDHNNHLFLGAYPIPEATEFNDLYIFQCQNNPTLVQLTALSTNGFPGHKRNLPFHLESVSNTENLLMKRHEIVKLIYNQQQQEYSFQQLMPGYGNYFRNASMSDENSRIFITKMTGGGFLEYTNQWALSGDIQTGFGIYSSFNSENTDKNYYFTKKHIANGHIYIDEHNLLGTLTDFPFVNPIGDCIYNPHQGHILVSENLGSPNTAIKVYSETEGGLNLYYTIQTGQARNGEMFVSNLGEHLYFSGTDNVVPKVTIRNASNYGELLGVIDLATIFPASSDQLKVIYASNPYQTYFVFSDDYDPESDMMYPESTTQSFFYVLNPDNYSASPSVPVNHDQPRFLEAMYSDQPGESLPLKVFVAGLEPKITEISVDLNLNITTKEIPLEKPVSAIKYLSYNEIHELYIVTYINDMLSEVHRYLINTGNTELVAQINSRVAAMSFNSENKLLYLFGIGEDQLVVYQIDVVNDEPGIEQEQLHLSRMYDDKLARSLSPFVNEIIFDNENHTIFIPNGEFSSISKLRFDFDRMPLKPRVSWISFPRLNRLESGYYPAALALNDRIFPEVPLSMSATMEINEVVPGNPNTYDNMFIQKQTYESEWTWEEGGLAEVASHLGYVITFEDELLRSLELIGPVLDPNENFPLYSFVPNWTGYFLEQTQSPFDAIATEFLDNITWMAGQNWFCHKESAPGTKSTGYSWRCACEKERMEIQYGEMIKIYPSSDIVDFYWQSPGQPPNDSLKMATEYYTYEEQASYEPFLIELDTNDLPLEIGAFAGDSCIGATKVDENDTLVLIRGFTEGYEGEPVSFEMYYGFRKSSPGRIHKYLVSTPDVPVKQHREIMVGDHQHWYDISFKNIDKNDVKTNQSWMRCSPNPFNNQCTIHYSLPESGAMKLEALDIYGKCVCILEEGVKGNGEYHATFSPGETGLKNGIYFIRLTGNKVNQTDKVVYIY